MTEDKEPTQQDDELVTAGTATNSELNEVFTKMSEQLQVALASFMLQNIRDVEIAAFTAEAVYTISEQYASKGDLLILEMMKSLICLYPPLTRGVVFQMEGRFSKARAELAKGLKISSGATAILDRYARLPDADEEVLQMYQPVFSIFPILFRGSDASIQAEIVGYQGNTLRCVEWLEVAVAEFRQAVRLPSSLNPIFLALTGFCTSTADRLETRVEVFRAELKAEQGQRYLSPTGDKIFIIHGHDEAKWRELRDVLEDELDLKVTVLKEEPGASETLIHKFEEFADDCCYAFALLTPDDFVTKEGKCYFQSRPNVLFELGWFYGHFGRSRVCIVKKDTTEVPSDLNGILSIDFHETVSEGFIKIQDELKKAGVRFGKTRRPMRHSTVRAKTSRASRI
jgi:predicted nucleotide-binding protein